MGTSAMGRWLSLSGKKNRELNLPPFPFAYLLHPSSVSLPFHLPSIHPIHSQHLHQPTLQLLSPRAATQQSTRHSRFLPVVQVNLPASGHRCLQKQARPSVAILRGATPVTLNTREISSPPDTQLYKVSYSTFHHVCQVGQVSR